jgi:hypothetical protein
MKFTEEHKRKISEAKKGKPNLLLRGKKRPPFSKEWKKKISDSKKGRNHPNWGKHLSEKTRFLIGVKQKGKLNNGWKGSKVGYWGIHKWIIRTYGQPDTCEHCGKTGLKGKQINWASINHKYERHRRNWIRLCVKCHSIYDKI